MVSRRMAMKAVLKAGEYSVPVILSASFTASPVAAASPIPPATGADLALSMTADNLTAPAQESTGTVTIPGGGFITTQFSVTNNGPADAINVRIVLTFTGEVTGTRTLALGTLSVGGQRGLLISGPAPAGGTTYTVGADVASDTPDPDPTNNHAELTISVV